MRILSHNLHITKPLCKSLKMFKNNQDYPW